MKISFMFTCYNRKIKTIKCIETVKKALAYSKENGIEITDAWYIVDGGSSDGTLRGIADCLAGESAFVTTVEGAFYSQGMRECMKLYLNNQENFDEAEYVCLINDDVEFYDDFLYRSLKVLCSTGNTLVLAGATDDGSRQTYGGIRYRNGVKKNHLIPRAIKYETVRIDEDNLSCHSFNANCVFIPGKTIKEIGPMDEKYVHSLGDFDYGMCIYEKGKYILSTDFYVGKCYNNEKTNTWMDRSVPRLKRIHMLNSVKGAPTKQWFYYLNKHFGMTTAIIRCIIPYIRIVLGR